MIANGFSVGFPYTDSLTDFPTGVVRVIMRGERT